ncbi:D-inositol 3-phosphate glycosyltransferase [compost metagenome]
MTRADVCFVVEGSYPYVTGGVASWVHQLITNMPDIRFSLLTLLPDASSNWVDKYEVPANVVSRKNVYLFGKMDDDGVRREASRGLVEAVTSLHDAPPESRCPYFRTVESLMRASGQSATSLLTARSSWRVMQELYKKRQRRVSFLDYFWTWRSIHGPMFRLLEAELPEAAVYHPVSTGYAGFLAGVAKLRHGAGVVLTEHGLYTREREIEIANAEWIYRDPGEGTAYAPYEPFFKGWWSNQYRFLGQLSYDLSDVIVTLHEANKKLQIQAGAPASKMQVVPNGIHPSAFEKARVRRDWGDRPFRVGLIGRVVPIKDVKTYLRAIQIVAQTVPVEAYVLGPTEEDPAYHAECMELVKALKLESTVTFTGKVSLSDWLPKLDLNVLTSVSESQPLVILEASASGIPTVSTDVGACREMLEGKPGDDALLGPSGMVTPVVSPGATAAAIIALARNPERHAEMAQAGIRRVEGFYRQEAVFDTYRALYRSLAGGHA